MKRMTKAFLGLGLGLALLSGAPLAVAEDKVCKHETCWGAVGFGPGETRGFSYWYGSKDDALARVRRECPGCTVVESFANECASLAVASAEQWGLGKGPDKDVARSAAMSACKARGGAACKVRVWGCSRRKS